MGRRLDYVVRIRLSRELAAQLEAEAKRGDRTVSELVRDVLADYLGRRTAGHGLEHVERALDRVLARHVDRLAGLTAKAVKSAETGLWLQLLELKADGRIDADEALRVAEMKAVEYLRGRGVDDEA